VYAKVCTKVPDPHECGINEISVCGTLKAAVALSVPQSAKSTRFNTAVKLGSNE